MALNFASGQYVSVGSATALDDLGAINTAFTVWAWVYRTSNGANQHIMTKDGSFPSGWVFLVDNAGGEGQLRFVLFKTSTEANWAQAISVSGAIPLNTWTFVAATHESTVSGTSTVKLFVGSLSADAAEPTYATQQAGSNGTPDTDASYNLYIGNLQRATTLPFLGREERCGIVRRALTASELRVIQRGTLIDANVPNTLGLWTPEVNGSGTIRDHSGNGNTGTLSSPAPTSAVGPPLIYPYNPSLWTVNWVPPTSPATLVNATAFSGTSIAKPSGLSTGDLWMIFCSGSFTAPAISGFTVWAPGIVGTTTGEQEGVLLYRVADGSEGATVTINETVARGVSARVSGADTSNPINATFGGGQGNSAPATINVTSTITNTLILGHMGATTASGSFTPATGTTEVIDTTAQGGLQYFGQRTEWSAGTYNVGGSGGRIKSLIGVAIRAAYGVSGTTIDTDIDPATTADTSAQVLAASTITTTADAATSPDTVGSVGESSSITTTVDPAVGVDTTGSVNFGSSITSSAPDVAFGTDTNATLNWGTLQDIIPLPATCQDTIGSVLSVISITTAADPATGADTSATVNLTTTITTVADAATGIDTLATVGGGASATISTQVDAAIADGQSAQINWGGQQDIIPLPATCQDTTAQVNIGHVITSTVDPSIGADTTGSIFFGSAIGTTADPAIGQDTSAVVTGEIVTQIITSPDPAVGQDMIVAVLTGATITTVIDPAVGVDTTGQVFPFTIITTTRGLASGPDTFGQVNLGIDIIANAGLPATAGNTFAEVLLELRGLDASRPSPLYNAGRLAILYQAGRPTPGYLAYRRDFDAET